MKLKSDIQNRRKMTAVWLFLFLSVLFLAKSVRADQKITETKRVLFISSYDYSWETVPLQMEGIRETLSDDVMLDYEFMDTKNVDDARGLWQFYQHISHKLEIVAPYDVIIVGDDAALKFATMYRSVLFPETPVIFEGINDIERAEAAAQDDLITGVVERLSYQDNLELAMSLYPDARRIVGIVDDTITGEGEKKQFHANEKKYPEYQFQELNASLYTKEEFAARLQQLSEDSIIFFLICSVDRDGNVYTSRESASWIEEHTTVPVFRMAHTGIGYGLFGGKVVSFKESGAIAASMAMDILNGKDPAEIAMENECPQQYLFDEKIMHRYGIRRSQLPKDAVFVNAHVPFVVRYAGIIIRALIVTVILLLGIGWLGNSLHLKRRNATLAIVETRNRQLAHAIEDAERAYQAKTLFFSGISHEIRTPLNGILGITDLTKRCVEDSGKVAENLEKIEVSSRMLLHLLNDVLDMSAMETDKLKISYSQFDLFSMLDSIVSMYDTLCSQKGIRLCMEISGVTEQQILGDELRLGQILNNLLSNALKFTDPGGHINLTVTQQKSEEETVYIQFAVQDDGCGMSEDMKQRVFLPFEQEDAKTALQYGGSGLGMSITKGLVELLHGHISVESEKGKGTLFRVSLPFGHVRDSIEKQDQEEKEYDLTGMHILLVDDTEFNLEVTSELLELTGASVECARNGLEALERFQMSRLNEFDAILMDVQMPVMNGHEAAEKIRMLNRGDAKTVLIFAMTANAFSEDVAASLEAGMNDHITKPLDMEVLYEKLDRYYHSRA